MIEYAMFAALGFLVASMLAVLFAGPFWNRAARLTRKRLEATMPMSLADIQADKDQLRAQYAVELRRLEMAHDREKENAARFLIERNKYKVEIGELRAKMNMLAAQLSERGNASTVLEQTVRKRIPDLEQQLERARRIVAGRDRDLARMTTAYENQTEALGIAKKTARRYSDEIGLLRETLESGGGAARRGGDDEDALAAENRRLQAEISRMRQELERLRLVDAEDSATLRREIQNLAVQIMQGAPPARVEPEPPAPDLEEAEGGEDTEDAEEAAADARESGKDSARPAPRRGGKSGASLGERLKKLTERTGA